MERDQFSAGKFEIFNTANSESHGCFATRQHHAWHERIHVERDQFGAVRWLQDEPCKHSEGPTGVEINKQTNKHREKANE